MNFIRPIAAAAVTFGAGLAVVAPAWAAPSEFTSKGVATSYQQGKKTSVPNTLYYDKGRIRLEMSQPVSADGTSAFSVVIAREGGDTITMLNPSTKEAMKLEAASLEAVTDNPSLQKISNFKLTEFAKVFRSQSKKVGADKVAGQACTVLEQKNKQGVFRLWLSDQHEIPMRFAYYENGKPAFTYTVNKLALGVNLPASSFTVPKGYEVTDLAEMLKGMESPHH